MTVAELIEFLQQHKGHDTVEISISQFQPAIVIKSPPIKTPTLGTLNGLKVCYIPIPEQKCNYH